MEMYFLKSAACLAVLMLFYKLLLEKENMHVFKRFYLLAAVLVSFAIPWITFTSYVEIPAVPYTNFFEVEEGPGTEEISVFASLWAVLLWVLYGLGVLFFGIKFCRNLQEILQKIKRNPQVKAGNTTNVLLQEEVSPHTFWTYIFLNRAKYQRRQIPEEVFEHEQAHARQRHSLDILLMELLQVIFWFHPLLYLVKRAIKLNHEFLADRAVINKGIKTSTYQEMLLAFSSSAANSSFVNSINYSSIKKRFTVMKTHTSKNAIWARSLLLVPVLAVLIYSCSTSEELERPIGQNDVKLHSGEATPEMIAEYNRIAKNYNMMNGAVAILSTSDYNKLLPIYNRMTEEQKQAAEPFPDIEIIEVVEDSPVSTPQEEIEVVQDEEQIEVVEVIVDRNASPKMIAEYNKLAKHYGELAITEKIVQEEGFKRMMYIFGMMTESQRRNATELPPPPPPAPMSEEQLPPPPPPPSPEQAIKSWDAEGAEFYFQGKRISAQDALDLVASGKKLQVKAEENGAVKKIRLSLDND